MKYFRTFYDYCSLFLLDDIMFKNILVASDGSKCGDKAVDMAIDLASKYDAKISALYIMDFRLDFSYDDLDDAGGAVLDDITAKGKEKDVVVVEHIITADPIIDMETMIRKINPDIAIFGAYGLSMEKEDKIDYKKIGSVALNALKVAKVPVLLVK